MKIWIAALSCFYDKAFSFLKLKIKSLNFFGKKFKWLLVGLLVIANFFVWYAVSWELPKGELLVTFLDVGQGDAIYVRAPSGNDLLIDGGPDRSVLSGLGQVMPFYDRALDVILVSHQDSDHIGGLPAVINSYMVSSYFDQGLSFDSEVSKQLFSDLTSRGVKTFVASRGTIVHLDSETKLEIIFPEGLIDNWETNRASLVAKLTYGGATFLFTGDAPEQIENYLATRDGAKLRADVLKVSHHGSKNSSSLLFTGFAAPQYAVISVGKNNRFGHPDKEVLEILDQLKIETLRTDELGAITFSSDGHSVEYVDK